MSDFVSKNVGDLNVCLPPPTVTVETVIILVSHVGNQKRSQIDFDDWLILRSLLHLASRKTTGTEGFILVVITMP